MSYRSLAIMPVLLGIVYLIAAWISPTPTMFRVAIELSKILALLGCIAAALAFEHGDYLRRAWTFNGACLAFLLARDVTIPFAVQSIALQNTLVIIANLCSIVGTFLMARAWQVSGLEAKRSVLVAIGVVVALVVGGGAIVVDVRARAVVALASDLGDFVSLCLIAPVIMTALAMRGGVLRWAWGLFALSLVCWLFYDATHALRTHLSPNSLKVLNELFRTLACTYLFAAGLAQRRAVLAPEAA